MEKVSVNKGLLIGAVAVAVSLLALGFVLGRASGSGSPSGQPSGRELPSGLVASPVTGLQPLPRPSQPFSTRTPAGVSITESSDLPPVTGPAPAPAAGERGGASSDPDRAAVAAYFDAVDHLQPGKMSGDAEGTAREMAAALAKGDTSDLDGMIRETEAARERLVALTPPTPCIAHYRESLGSLDDALGMLRSLKTAMGSPDPAGQLTEVASRAGALRSRSEALQKEDLALRLLYGLAR
jgi:hypothetical protein